MRFMLAKVAQPKIHASVKAFLASRPLEVVAVDFTLLEPASDGSENIIVVTDVFTKYTQAYPIKEQKAATVAKPLLREWFMKFGVPEKLHTLRNFERENYASYMVSRKHVRLPIGLKAMHNVRGITGHSIICYAASLRRRKGSGQNICLPVYAYNVTFHHRVFTILPTFWGTTTFASRCTVRSREGFRQETRLVVCKPGVTQTSP